MPGPVWRGGELVPEPEPVRGRQRRVREPAAWPQGLEVWELLPVLVPVQVRVRSWP